MGCQEISEGLSQISQASANFMEQTRQMQTRHQTRALSKHLSEKMGMPGLETDDPALLNAMGSIYSKIPSTLETQKTQAEIDTLNARGNYYKNPPKKSSGYTWAVDPKTGKSVRVSNEEAAAQGLPAPSTATTDTTTSETDPNDPNKKTSTTVKLPNQAIDAAHNTALNNIINGPLGFLFGNKSTVPTVATPAQPTPNVISISKDPITGKAIRIK